jgi:hypothetical protein
VLRPSAIAPFVIIGHGAHWHLWRIHRAHPYPSDLPRELLHAHAGLLVALRRAPESLHDHVCDAEGVGGGYSLCRLRGSFTAATAKAARVYDAVEAGPATPVGGDAVDDALVAVQGVPDGQRLPHPDGVGGGPQRGRSSAMSSPTVGPSTSSSGNWPRWRGGRG